MLVDLCVIGFLKRLVYGLHQDALLCQSKKKKKITLLLRKSLGIVERARPCDTVICLDLRQITIKKIFLLMDVTSLGIM